MSSLGPVLQIGKKRVFWDGGQTHLNVVDGIVGGEMETGGRLIESPRGENIPLTNCIIGAGRVSEWERPAGKIGD